MTNVLQEIAERVSGVEEEGERTLREILAPLASKIEQLDAEIEARRGELKAREAQRERLKQVLDAAQPKAKKKRQQAGETGPKPSPQAIEQAVRLLATKTEPQGAAELAKELGLGASSVGNQLRLARQLDLVRHTGNGGQTGRAKLYLVMPNAIERLERGEVQWP